VKPRAWDPLWAILLAALALRLYWLGANRALWPDEAVYLLGARGFAGLDGYGLPAARPPALPLIWAGFERLGLGERAIRASVAAFSLLGVFLLYRLGRELFDRRVGLLAAWLLAVSAPHLFFSQRVLTDVPALALWLAALWLLARACARGGRGAAAAWLAPLAVLLVLTRFAHALLIPVLALLLLATRARGLWRERRAWLGAAGALALGVAYLVWSAARHGHPFAAWLEREAAVSSSYAAQVGERYAEGPSAYLAWLPSVHLDPILLAALLLALCFAAWDLRARAPGARRDLLLLLCAGATFASVSAIGHAEARFLLPLLPLLFLLIARALARLYELAARRSAPVAAIALAVVLGASASLQLARAGQQLRAHAGDFLLHRRVGEWLAEHAPEDARVFAAEPEISQYYSGRSSAWYPATLPELEAAAAAVRPAWLVYVVGERAQPDYVAALVAGREPLHAWRLRRRGEVAGAVYALPLEPPGQGPR
jgi:4-amino-4-deoxy-L-arabinose transferase-like glycosyltransferase